jgi:hypothetical protein
MEYTARPASIYEAIIYISLYRAQGSSPGMIVQRSRHVDLRQLFQGMIVQRSRHVDLRQNTYSVQCRGWARSRFIPIGISIRLAFVVDAAVVFTVEATFDVLVAALLELVGALLVDDAAFEELAALDVEAFEVEEAALLVEVAAFDVEEAALAAEVTKISVWAPSEKPYRLL